MTNQLSNCALLLILSLTYSFILPMNAWAHRAIVSAEEILNGTQQDAQSLKTGRPVERELKAGETQIYQVELAAGQLLQVAAEQRGIDVTLAIFDPGKLQLIGVDRVKSLQGSESATVVALASGTFYVGVQSRTKEAPTGRYELRILALREATFAEKVSIGADLAFGQGESLRRIGTKETLLRAVDKYEESQKLYGAGGNKKSQATALNRIGQIHSSLGNPKDALEKLNLALSIRHEIGEKAGEAAVLNNLGEVYNSQAEKRRALNSFQQAWEILRNLDEPRAKAAVLNNLGAVQNDLGQRQQALQSYDQALALYRESRDIDGEARTLNNIGKLYDDTGDRQKAIDKYEAALRLKSPDREIEARIGNNLGAVYSALGDKKKALEYYEKTRNLLHELGDSGAEAVTLSNIGEVHSDLGEKEIALSCFEQALSLHRQVNDKRGEAATLNNEASVRDSLGQKQLAFDLYQKALSLTQTFTDLRGEARTLNNLGSFYDSLGEKRKALIHYEQARQRMIAIEDRPGEAATLNNIAGVHSSLGEKQEALSRYSDALKLYRMVMDRAGEATVLNNLGEVYNDLGDKQQALNFFNQADEIFRVIGNPTGEGVAFNNIGSIYFDLGEVSKALDNYNQALTRAQRVHNLASEAKALNNLATVDERQGDLQKALVDYEKVLALQQGLQDRDGEATSRNNIGVVQSELGQHQAALQSFDKAFQLARSIGNRAQEATTLNNIGLAYYDLGERAKALGYYEQALALMRVIGYRRGEAGTLSNIGLLREGLGEKQGAVDAYLRSIELFEEIRGAASIEEIKIGLAESAAVTYERAIVLLVDVGQAEKAFNLTEHARARALLDQLGNVHPRVSKSQDRDLLNQEQRLALKLNALDALVTNERSKLSLSTSAALKSLEMELDESRRSYETLLTRMKLTNPEYASLRVVNPVNLPEIQRELSADTSLLSYFVTGERIVAFIIGKNSLKVVEIPVSRKDIEKYIQAFRRFDNTDEAHPESLRQLYAWLISPVKPYLKTPALGVIPHDVLHYVPFAGLTDGRSYFGAEHRLFQLPSANVLRFVEGKKKQTGGQVLAVAQSRAIGLSELSYVDEEVEAIAKLYDTKPFHTDTMSKSDFVKQAGASKIIHIAAHAELNTSNPLFSRILLATSNKEDASDAGLTVKDIVELDLSNTWLVVLSACETQLGSIRAGDDMVALNRALIYAGTPTVIASLWVVDDKSTSDLMKVFYTELKGGYSKSAALQAAQLAVRRQHPHPYYWAGFVLTGNGTNR